MSSPPSESVTAAPPHTADLRSASAPEPVILRMWPSTIVAFGLGLSALWIGLLGYGLFKILALAI